MRPNLITRLKEEWNNLDPVDPLRGLISDAIDALAEQPAQQQEPIAWLSKNYDGGHETHEISYEWQYGAFPVYTSPPANKPLRDAQIGAVAAEIWGSVLIAPQSYQAFARAIESAHGITGESK